MGEERRFSREFKLAALARMAAGENVSALARELGVRRKYLYQWRERFRAGGPVALRSRGRPTKSEVLAMQSGAEVALPAPSAIMPTPLHRTSWSRRSGGSRSWSGRSGSSRLSSIFFSKPCGKSGRSARGAARLAGRRLRGHPSDDGVPVARQDRDRADVHPRRGEPGRLLPALAGLGAGPGRDGTP